MNTPASLRRASSRLAEGGKSAKQGKDIEARASRGPPREANPPRKTRPLRTRARARRKRDGTLTEKKTRTSTRGKRHAGGWGTEEAKEALDAKEALRA
jgi:hypothetical protein